ncbi:Nuclear pore complex component [Pleurostoma richardsiae]|uniref:Nuclear pore complex component n=1 Tax=Pleurostoma richardsiae TaxID=41990 RepID=A0AA38S0B2_9PEZI|nr:Nuclear pore complex component [Pleurostoma richardsiae]
MSSTALATSRAPATPTAIKKPLPVSESPGNWKHPRLNEIARRQSASVFSEANIKTILYNIGALVIIWTLHSVFSSYGPSQMLSKVSKGYLGWGYLFLQLIPLFNISMAVLPLMRRQDDISDIPLTPAQRKLLGLPPSSAPPTPGSVYSTPPKYSRTPSISGSVGSKASYSASPLSNKGNGSPAYGSPTSGRRPSGSPFSPANTSPLLQKAMAGGVNGVRRSSFGSPSPLGASTASSLFPDAPGTPSPSSPSKRTSVGLNNKWLYEKGRRTSGNTWL